MTRETEYGGSDTHRTAGIQLPPHPPSADEKLRLMYRHDESTGEDAIPPELGPVQLS